MPRPAVSTAQLVCPTRVPAKKGVSEPMDSSEETLPAMNAPGSLPKNTMTSTAIVAATSRRTTSDTTSIARET